MSTYEIIDEFATSAEHYWNTFFSPQYNAALWPALQIRCEEQLYERQGEGKDLTARRVLRLTPDRELPAILRKLVSGAISYTESNQFTRATNTLEVVTVPSFLADKITTKGIYTLVELEPMRVRRVWQGVCECKIPLVGRKVEEVIIDEVRRSYKLTTDFTRAWLRDHPVAG
jgi:hypothetical protein